MSSTNWIEIKNEYINTNTSYRKLSEKYQISFSTLEKRARAEGWRNERLKTSEKIAKKVRQKTVEKIVNTEVDRIGNILKTADIMQRKINESLSQLTIFIDMFGNKHDSDVVDVNKLRKLVAALKDISDIISANDKTEDTEKLDKILEMIGGVI